MSITITVPNDDHVALRAMAKALEEIAVARGAPAQGVSIKPFSERMKLLEKALSKETPESLAAKFASYETELDTTSQQVESLAIPVEANGATYETDLGSDEPEAVCVADSTGTPWDERIHSASKALNSDGTWRLRRKPKDMDEAEWSDYVSMIKADLQHPVECGGVEQSDPRFKCDKDFPAFEIPTERKESYPNIFSNDEPPVTPAGDDFHVDAGEVTEQQIAAIPAPPLPGYELDHRNVTGTDVEEKITDFSSSIKKGISNAQHQNMSFYAEPAALTFPQVMQFLTERHGCITSAQVDDIIADMGLNSIMDLNTQPEHTGPFITRVKALLGE